MDKDKLQEWSDYGGYPQPSLFAQDAPPLGQDQAVQQSNASTTPNQPTKEDRVEQQAIPIHPVPTDINIGQVETGPGQPNMVIVILGTPVGTSHYFFPPEVAEQVGNQLVTTARQAKSGLVLPKPKLVQ